MKLATSTIFTLSRSSGCSPALLQSRKVMTSDWDSPGRREDTEVTEVCSRR